jgi:ketosteroid isomerase-like protein
MQRWHGRWMVVAGIATSLAWGIGLGAKSGGGGSSAEEDAKTVAALDKEYQEAVKKNDAKTMERILADDFILVTGSGKVHDKAELVGEARDAKATYERNDELEQKVRVWGDTAVATVKLWEKGTEDGKAFDRKFWYSDTYVRTKKGWRYVFGQSSLPPTESK